VAAKLLCTWQIKESPISHHQLRQAKDREVTIVVRAEVRELLYFRALLKPRAVRSLITMPRFYIYAIRIQYSVICSITKSSSISTSIRPHIDIEY
jgi:hypothetical protein